MGLFHPLPTTALGAAVNVGAKRVFNVPVGVYVGSRLTWVNDGEIVGGGKACDVICAGSIVPAPAYGRVVSTQCSLVTGNTNPPSRSGGVIAVKC